MSRSTTLKGVGIVVALGLSFVCGGVLFSSESEPTSLADAADEVWTCSMHPQIRQSGPGDCPICGMDLIPATQMPDDGGDRVVLTDRARALAQVRTTRVTRQVDASAEVRLQGIIEPAESTRRNVTTWIGGRIDRLHVNTTGESVRRGQVIATLYSPEVYAAHQDLITARQQVERLSTAPDATRASAEAALTAARQRLRLLGVPDAEIDAMATASEPERSVRIRSPFSGTVIERVATEGAYVDTGAALYRVADLSTLWVQLDAYEGDLSRLAVGQTVQIRVEALPGEVFEGRVAFIDPTVDPQRRTARVRVEVDNSEGRLRPGLFAEAVVQATGADTDAPLVIPASAPLFTGRRSVVYVEVGTADGVAYEPRTVRLGSRLGEVYPVVSGLSEGDRVVSRGAFALDADLQIRGGDSMMQASSPSGADTPVVALTSGERARLAPVLTHYLELQVALAEDDLPTATAAAAATVEAIDGTTLSGTAESVWEPLRVALLTPARRVAGAATIEAAREGFEPLSLAVEALLRQFGNPLDAPVQVAYCPMAMGSDGAIWVQQNPTVDNAYYGDAMRTCGEIQAEIAPNTYLDGTTGPATGTAGHAGHNH